MNKVGIVLAGILLVLTINSAYYFFNVAKVSFVEWIVFNACAPSSLAYLIGFVIYLSTKDRTAMYIAILPLFFFGGMGLFLFPWGGYNNIPQISHIFMVLNIAWVLFGGLQTGDYKAAAVGLLIGLAIFVPFISFQQTYAYTHPESFTRILGVGVDQFQEKYNIKK